MKDWEKEFDDRFVDANGFTREEFALDLKSFISNLLSTQRKELLAEVREELILSLPSDAENLSTLTGPQAQDVVDTFLKKLTRLAEENK